MISDKNNCACCSGTKIANFYTCNICGEKNYKKFNQIERDSPSRYSCGSSLRVRSIIKALSIELFGSVKVLNAFPRRPDITGIGMTDWDNYANILPRKLNYINTFYDKEPKLDITSDKIPIKNQLDFIISSDVFEHVAPPVKKAFENSFNMLKKGGVFIFSVPYTSKINSTVEHFPDAYNYYLSEINIQGKVKKILTNKTKKGEIQVFENLVFHGCDALEMRVFSENSVFESLVSAGFNEIVIYDEDDCSCGIVNKSNQKNSYIISAKKNSKISGHKIIKRSSFLALNLKNKIYRFINSRLCFSCKKIETEKLSKCIACNGDGSIPSGQCQSCNGFGSL
jgi:SAM-dependent methyltransferase